MSVFNLKVPVSKLARPCKPNSLGFETTDDVQPLDSPIGQERAISALNLGLEIGDPGFNIFVSGAPGTGRTTAVKTFLDKTAHKRPVPADWAYVHNFQDPSQPKAISLPCGMAKEFRQDMKEVVDTCSVELPKVFESEEYTKRIEQVMERIQEQREGISAETEQSALKLGFSIRSTPAGITPVPMNGDTPMTPEEFEALSDEQKQLFSKRAESLQKAVGQAMVMMRRLNKQATDEVRQVDKDIIRFTLTPIVNELQAKYRSHQEIVDYLDAVEEDMAESHEVFKPGEDGAISPAQGADDDLFIKYRVNDLLDNSTCDGTPVIFEYSPTYYNLFGRIEYKARMGAMTTDLTMIKPGALHKANGGYLVLQAKDLLAAPLSWEALKRTLRAGQVRIENIGEQMSPLPSSTLRPEPIPIRLQIILIGTGDLLRLLQMYDEDFRRYFKISAEFDYWMERNAASEKEYAGFVKARCLDNKLRPFHKTAVARVIDYSSRLVDHQDKLTTRFMDVSDLITESNYWAVAAKSKVVKGEHVMKAIEQKRYRANLTEERMQEYIEENTIHIATEGSAVGQVNGLAVYSLGDYSFGKPTRITARAALGRGTMVNVEREARMSGRIHDKGFMILQGFLQGQYGQNKMLSLSASIVFEQSYSEIDGDSASSTELYALLSELSGLPISQEIAVTGSVNQRGDVQAIGGATHKIEGFYDLCKSRGLNGRQGVIIPKDNVKNLMLKDEVLEAVKDGKFTIYAVSTIDEGIEVLTGVAAGKRKANGKYPEGSVHDLVEGRLNEMSKHAKEILLARERGLERLSADAPGEQG
ncbi:MAG: ATP-dependent protease [SAR202 cluster bacterium]|nr:ATP-dependent protease [SAR202 cluster bacterium]